MIEKILAIAAAICLFVVVGTIGYTEFAKQEVTVLLELKDGEDPFVALPQIVPKDSSIKEVREVNRAENKYVIMVETRRNKLRLLEWLRSSSRVERADAE